MIKPVEIIVQDGCDLHPSSENHENLYQVLEIHQVAVLILLCDHWVIDCRAFWRNADCIPGATRLALGKGKATVRWILYDLKETLWCNMK